MTKKNKYDEVEDMTARPILYIIVRNDLDSMTNGKAEAHSAHAACAFMYEQDVKYISSGIGDSEKNDDDAISQWCKSTPHGFGTQINLNANMDEMSAIKSKADEAGIICNIITDPTYPFIVNGECFHREEQTALYIFGRANNFALKQIIGKYKLKP